MTEQERRWPARRFSQAISEGDGISVIPLLRGALPELARAAETAGAEALAVDSVGDVEAVRAITNLPVLVRHVDANVAALERARVAGTDACVLHYEGLADAEGLLEELVGAAWDLGLDCALDVRDEDELEEALDRLDPEILLLSERNPDRGELELERTLDLLADVPVGKLVVSESVVRNRDQVLELERAGVDGVMLEAPLAADDGIAEFVSELTGRHGSA